MYVYVYLAVCVCAIQLYLLYRCFDMFLDQRFFRELCGCIPHILVFANKLCYVILAPCISIPYGRSNGQRTLIQVQSFHLGHAFAAIMADGSVVCWGDRRIGGDCQRVQEQLRHVTQLQSSSGAFAAIQSDGTVTAWGNSACGGDSSKIQDQLRYSAPRVAGKFCH